MHRSALPGKQKSKPFKGVSNATNHETQSLLSRSSRCNTRRINRSPKGGTTAAGVPRPTPSGRLGRFVRRGPKRKRLQPRARVPALERLPHTRRRQVVDYHGVGPLCDHALAARRILNPKVSRNAEEAHRSAHAARVFPRPSLSYSVALDVGSLL